MTNLLSGCNAQYERLAESRVDPDQPPMPPEGAGSCRRDRRPEERHMDKRPSGGQTFFCPMHSDVRQRGSGKCPKCGMDLLPEGTRFALLRHMTSSPLHLAVMAVVMVAVMGTAMMLMR